MEAARTMLADSGLPKNFWAEAVNTANYIFNRIEKAISQKTPLEELYGIKPSLKEFHHFGSEVYR